ncbi:MAG TPA: hypothetical protein VN027_19145 [Isoptericola sp.]|nr:hypothetical protein [Isoptericola sp.]
MDCEPLAERRTGARRTRAAATAALAVVALALLGACAAGPNPGVDTSTISGAGPYGFWWGLWQGMILPVTFVVSLFTDSVSVYEVHNTGNWYDFGFVLGISMVFGGPLGARRARH